MSENRDTPAGGAPVEESEASRTEVLEAVQRSKGTPSESERGADPVIDAEGSDASATEGADGDAAEGELSEVTRRERIASVDTELSLDVPSASEAAEGAEASETLIVEETVVERPAPDAVLDDLPSAAAEPVAAKPGSDRPARDGEIRISADHPMAALYMQTPMPPELKGNRVAGIWISLLATIIFALVFAGVIALSLAPTLAPSQFVDGLLDALLTYRTGAAVLAFVVGLVLIVLIVGKAGWWAYVLGGFPVGVLVWAATALGSAADADGLRSLLNEPVLSLIGEYGLTIPAIGAGLAAREVTIWFGAWIGSRGRRVKSRNAAALAEYETALGEVSAQS